MTAFKPAHLRMLQKHMQMFLLSILMIVAFSLTSAAQENPPKTTVDDNNPPREIKDIFVRNAVTLEEMIGKANKEPYMTGEVVVALQWPGSKKEVKEKIKETNWSSFAGIAETMLHKHLMSVEKNGQTIALVHLKLPAGTDVTKAMTLLYSRTDVLWSSPNFFYVGDPKDIIPNDPSYGSQYHHPLMKNNLAWDITFGTSNIIMAVTDDGVQTTHPDLVQNIWVNTGEIAGDLIDNDNNGYVDDVNGWDFSFTNNDPNPNITSNDHGTHVAGILGGRTNNGIGIAGVAGQSTIMPLQFYTTAAGGLPWNAALINETFTYATDNGARIVSTSYNVDGFANDPVYLAGAQYIIDGGGIYFNSAGNNNQLNPARQVVTQAIFVSSTDAADLKSSFSNYGTGIDVAAPGSSIYATITNSGYGTKSGTSMSTPNASGSAALVWSLHPTWTNYQVAAQLLATTDNIDALNPTYAGLLGTGRVNNQAALTTTLPAPKVKSLTGLPANNGSALTGTVSSFTVAFNQVMDAATVNNLSNYELRNAGVNNQFDDGDDVLITISTTSTYRIGTNSMTFQLSALPLPCGNYRFRILAGGLRNPFSTALDGDGNGTGGDNYVSFFALGTPFYADNDGDGFGTGAQLGTGCNLLPGFASNNLDCNDNNNAVNPNATEICNGIDDNCDGNTDALPGTTVYTFTNTTATTIPGTGSGATTGAPSNPYPSTINVSGLSGNISTVKVKLNQFGHTLATEVDMLLVSPTGQKFVIFSDAGNGTDVVNLNFTLDDAAANTLPLATLTSGTYKPTNYGSTSDLFPAPAPAGPYISPAPIGTATMNATFGSQDPNGNWNLYIVDDASGDVGSLGGWELLFTLYETICSNVPTPVVSVTQPNCTTATGSISITDPTGAGYTYSTGGAYQAGTTFNNVLPGTYNVTAQFNGNTSSPASVTIDPAPATPAAPTASNQTVCTNGSPTQTLTATASGGSITWYDAATNGSVVGTPVQVGVGTSTYYAEASNGTCSSLTRTQVVLTINAAPSAPVSGGNQVQCAQAPVQTLTATATGAGLTWHDAASNGNTVASPTLNTIGTVTYYAQSSDGTCSSLTRTAVTLTINATPAAPVSGGDQEQCAQIPVQTLTATATGVGLTWHDAATGGNIVASPILNTIGTVTYYAQSSNGSCNSLTRTAVTLRISQNTATPGAVQGLANVCAFAGTSTPLTYSVNPVNGATGYIWTVPPTVTILSGQNTNSITVTIGSGFAANANKIIRVSATSACGVGGERLFYLLSQLPGTPSAITASHSNICAFLGNVNVVTYKIKKVASATSYEWTAQAGTTTISHPEGLGVNDTLVTVAFSSGFTTSPITVRAINGCGTSSLRSLNIVRTNPSTPSPIAGPTNVCNHISPNGTIATYSVTPHPFVTVYNWTLPPNVTNVTGLGTNTVSFLYPAGFTSGTISVNASNGCGTSSNRSLSVSRLVPSAVPIFDVVLVQDCPNRVYTYTIAAMPANTNSIFWTVPANGTLVSGQGTTSITVSYPPTTVDGAVTARGDNNCGSSTVRTLTIKLAACPPPLTRLGSMGNFPNNDQFSVTIYPNPASYEANILIKSSSNAPVSIRVTDALGRQVLQMNQMPLQLIKLGSKLRPGTYFVELTQGDKRIVEKLIRN